MRSDRSTLGWGILVVAVVFTGVIGCDGRPKRVAISGQVLIDGEPLKTGVIQFMPTGTRPSYGKIEDGNFTMTCYEDNDGVIPGTHKVTINGSEIVSSTKIQWYAPKKYSDPNTSGLTVEIDKPNDELVIEITWDGGKPFIEQSGRESVDEGDESDV